MANVFPTSLNNYITGAGSPTLLSAGHAAEHNAIEAKIGIDSSAVVTSLDYKLKNAASIDPGHHHTNGSVDSLASSKVTGLPTFPAGTIVGTTDSQALTNKDLTGAGNTFPTSLVTLTGTQILTNKRRTRRLVTTTQSATPTINADNTDIAKITGLAQAITSFTTNLSGTPNDGDLLEIRVTDNGTARGLTFGASFQATTVALPTTTVINTELKMLFEWNSVASKWDCVATA